MSTLGAARVTDCRIASMTLSGVDYLAARFDVEVVTSGALDLAATMDALAAAVVDGGVTARAYPWPVESAEPPCAIVAYPEAPIDFDRTFARGSDTATFPIYVLVGKAHDRSARDRLSVVITGATGVKDALDGPLEAE